MIRICLLVLAGGLAAQHSRVPLNPDLCALILGGILLVLPLRRVRGIAVFLLGFTLFMQAGNSIIDARLDARFAGDSILTRVRIADFPKLTGATVSMLIEPVSDTRLPPRSRVTWFNAPQIPVIGDIWEFELRLRRPHGYANTGVFSLENWMFREKLHAAGYVVAGKRNRRVQTGELSWVESYRLKFVTRVQRSSAAPVLAAIGVGARHLISRDEWDRYARTGSSHLMAISGLHIGLAAAAAFALAALLSGVLRLRGNHLDHAIIAAAGISAAYALISGFAVPSQRATIMFGLVAMATLSRRRPDPMRIVAQACLLVFVIDPVSSMTPGFSLSFGAVVILLWHARTYWYPGKASRLVQLLMMQMVLLLGLMPLTTLNFQRIAFSAPVVNMLTVPVFSFVTVPLTLASMVLHPVWEAASAIMLRASEVSIHVIQRIINGFAEIPFAAIPVAGVNGLDGAIGCLIWLPLLWIVLPRGWPGRWIAALGVLALLLHKPATPAPDCFDTHVLDVGQGLAVVVQSRQRTLVFDTGPSYRGGGSAAEQVILPFLQYKGIDRVDWLVVSHADDDHAGGVSTLDRRIRLGQIYAGEKLPDIGLQEIDCAAGRVWRADGIEYKFLHPGQRNTFSGNDSSCVLTISAGSNRLILTGDIELAGEKDVLARLPRQGANVVLIPHHGSLTSSSPAFVKRLRPDLAIASVGYANRWGFPKPEVTRRWEGAGAAVLDTATSGAISLRLCRRSGVSQLREERVRQRRFWHDPLKL